MNNSYENDVTRDTSMCYGTLASTRSNKYFGGITPLASIRLKDDKQFGHICCDAIAQNLRSNDMIKVKSREKETPTMA